jgi:hypothetical protein
VNASLWATRVWHEFRAGNLTRAFRDVLLKLNAYARGGVAFPSQATLAARTACSVRTVARALAVARDLDLISWAERRVRRGPNHALQEPLLNLHSPLLAQRVR